MFIQTREGYVNKPLFAELRLLELKRLSAIGVRMPYVLKMGIKILVIETLSTDVILPLTIK